MSGRVSETLLNSSIVRTWVYKQASTIGQGLRVTPSDCLETLPLPTGSFPFDFGSKRKELLKELGIGLTQLYNRFHDPTDRDPRLEELRELQREIDVAVVQAYGWDDLDLGHGFHEVPYLPENDRMRFTISEPARIEVLRRLAELNRRRYEEEVAQGLHTKGRAKKGSRKRAPRKTSRKAIAMSPGQTRLVFDVGASSTSSAPDAEDVIISYLRTHPGWHAKRDILAATGLADGAWNAAIRELVERGLVERRGERRGTRYRLNEQTVSGNE